MGRRVIPFVLAEEDRFACCHTCTGQDTSDCDDCEEANLYEFDPEAAEELLQT